MQNYWNKNCKPKLSNYWETNQHFYFFKGELQRQNKLISSERSFTILQNETKIIKIGQAVLEIFNFKDRDLDSLREKTTEKPKMLFF